MRRIWEVTPITGSPFGYEKVAVGTSVVALTPPVGSDRALIKLARSTGPIHFRDDGVNPSDTDGMLLEDGDAMVYDAENGLSVLKFIRTATATVDGDLRILYYGES